MVDNQGRTKESAKTLFPSINITTEGHKYLGSFIGTEDGKKKFVADQIKEWSKDIDALAEIAKSEPQLAYAAYILNDGNLFAEQLQTLRKRCRYWKR